MTTSPPGSPTPPAAGDSGARPSQSDEPRPSFQIRLAIILGMSLFLWAIIIALGVLVLSSGVADWGN